MSGGGVKRYNDWESIDSKNNPSFDNFFAGVGGVFYDVSNYNKGLLDKSSFFRICKLGDDIWLNAFTRLEGLKTYVVDDSSAHILNVQIPKDIRLFNSNVGENLNDSQIKAVEDFINKKYGIRIFNYNL